MAVKGGMEAGSLIVDKNKSMNIIEVTCLDGIFAKYLLNEEKLLI